MNSPLVQVAAGFVIGLVALGPAACGSAHGRLPPVVECKLAALKVLPTDPMQATVYDAVDVIERVGECDRLSDGGAP